MLEVFLCLKMSSDNQFQRASTACVCVFKAIIFFASSQRNYFENDCHNLPLFTISRKKGSIIILLCRNVLKVNNTALCQKSNKTKDYFSLSGTMF